MKTAFRNAAFLFGGEVAARAVGFLTTALLARRLGAEGFGQIGFATAVFAYGVAATDFGILTTAARTVAQDPATGRRLVGDIVSLRLLLGLAAAVLIALFALLLPKPPNVRLLLLLYGLGVVVQCALLEWMFIGQERLGIVALSRSATSLSYFGLVLVLVRSATSILFVPVAFVIASAVGMFILWLGHLRKHGWSGIRFNLQAWRVLLARAWPIGLAATLTQLHVNAGVIIMGLVGSFESVGSYSAAYRLVFFLMILDRVLQTVFLPVVSRFLALRRERLGELTGVAIRLVLTAALPLCTGLTLLAQPILTLVFGSQYVAAAAELRIMAWMLLLSMLTSLAGSTLVGAGAERVLLRATALGTLVSVALAAIGVQLLGGQGAAVALVTGEATILSALLPEFLRIARPKVDVRLASSIVATAAMAGAVVALTCCGLVTAVVSGAAVYLLILILTGGIRATDFGFARTA